MLARLMPLSVGLDAIVQQVITGKLTLFVRNVHSLALNAKVLIYARFASTTLRSYQECAYVAKATTSATLR